MVRVLVAFIFYNPGCIHFMDFNLSYVHLLNYRLSLYMFGFFVLVVTLSLFVSVVRIAAIRFYRSYQKDVAAAFHQQLFPSQSLLLETDLQFLPEVVKKYIRYTHSIGKPKVTHFRVRLAGKLRKDSLHKWMPFTSDQFNFITKSIRLFFMKAQMNAMPIAGYHHFEDGKATMDIRLLSAFKIAYHEDPELGVAETVTFFNDMCCLAPATLIDTRISWVEIDSSTVRATFSNNGIVVHALLLFNSAGALIDFISEDRFDVTVGKKIVWSTPLKNYRFIGGYYLMSNASAIYEYPEGPFTYGEFTLTDLDYNIKALQ